ncbi:MAG: lysophospholipase [Lachnospiraceae bacterium]|nr:lysophospholipase [Ruminococcus sp.]MCM1273946.1 lysophospholipase [Lachnospiraceae bacterium]
MKKLTGKFPSASGLCDARFYIYTPEKPKAALMLSHGMCEYIERYEDFAGFLCGNDIALAGNDHIGHGNSITDEDMLGYFGQERGYVNMVRDLHRMKAVLERQFPNIPHFLMGHSMGSFLARIYLSKYCSVTVENSGCADCTNVDDAVCGYCGRYNVLSGGDRWNGAVIMGTAGGLTGSAPLRRALDIMARNHGDLYRHELGAKLAFGFFNLRTENRRTPNDWLSRDDANVDKFCADPKCNFTFTVAGFRDLLNALMCANSKPVIENTPTDLPMLFLSGGMDPVGEYGNGVRSAAAKYLSHGCDVNLRIYREARHELIFELNRAEVMEDILEFLVKRI